MCRKGMQFATVDKFGWEARRGRKKTGIDGRRRKREWDEGEKTGNEEGRYWQMKKKENKRFNKITRRITERKIRKPRKKTINEKKRKNDKVESKRQIKQKTENMKRKWQIEKNGKYGKKTLNNEKNNT